MIGLSVREYKHGGDIALPVNEQKPKNGNLALEVLNLGGL
jgi:hypothetical protein